ncbi:MAG: hypothetical protein EOO65_04795, partial [Methanosarcinales archaeon]
MENVSMVLILFNQFNVATATAGAMGGTHGYAMRACARKIRSQATKRPARTVPPSPATAAPTAVTADAALPVTVQQLKASAPPLSRDRATPFASVPGFAALGSRSGVPASRTSSMSPRASKDASPGDARHLPADSGSDGDEAHSTGSATGNTASSVVRTISASISGLASAVLRVPSYSRGLAGMGGSAPVAPLLPAGDDGVHAGVSTSATMHTPMKDVTGAHQMMSATAEPPIFDVLLGSPGSDVLQLTPAAIRSPASTSGLTPGATPVLTPSSTPAASSSAVTPPPASPMHPPPRGRTPRAKATTPSVPVSGA